MTAGLSVQTAERPSPKVPYGGRQGGDQRLPTAVYDGTRYEPLAAMIGPLRCVADMSPSFGAFPKVKTLPRALVTQ